MESRSRRLSTSCDTRAEAEQMPTGSHSTSMCVCVCVCVRVCVTECAHMRLHDRICVHAHIFALKSARDLTPQLESTHVKACHVAADRSAGCTCTTHSCAEISGQALAHASKQKKRFKCRKRIKKKFSNSGTAQMPSESRCMTTQTRRASAALYVRIVRVHHMYV
jgi:hypothetical protein